MATKKKSSRKPNAAFMKPLQPDAALAEVVGDKPIPRTEITKRLWAYIKKNKLQNPKNRRNIDADDVANLALFLCSGLSKNITGQVIYVDAGYSIMGI